MKHLITVVVLLAMLLVTSSVIADDCKPTRRTYGNWQAGQQWSDYNRSTYYRDRANYWRSQNRPYLEQNARSWGRLYDNAREHSRIYSEFHGPYNRYGR